MVATVQSIFETAPRFVTVSGRKLAYTEVAPANPLGTILLLTGLSSKRLGWYKQITEFGRHYRTIALDHRDVGDSDKVSEPYAIADQADDAAAFLRALDIERANLVGISMGGFISLELTVRHPELVEKLVLVATSAGGGGAARPKLNLLPMFFLMPLLYRRDAGARAQMVYRRIMAPGYARRNPAEMQRVADIARYRPIHREAYNRQLRACQLHDVSKRLGEINKPTLVVHGTDDPLVPLANGQHLARNIKNARLIVYPETGHIPIIERAAEFNRDVLNFLAE